MTEHSRIRFDEPARYKIVVQGLMQNQGFPSFCGMDMALDRERNTSCLQGKVKDQAALAGIINVLYDHRFPIILVEMATEDAVDLSKE